MTQTSTDRLEATQPEDSSAASAGNKKRQLVLEIAAILIALTAAVVSALAWLSAAEANASDARTEITSYANEMVQLDRAADERNGTPMTVLAEQASAVIDQYDQEELRLAPATYRVLAQYTALGTENLRLARQFGNRAVTLAQEEENTLEEIRSRRVLIDVASQEGRMEEFVAEVERALMLADRAPEEAPDYRVLQSSKRFTGALAVYSSLWAAANHENPEWCEPALKYFQDYRDVIKSQADASSLEVSRRAYRLRTHMDPDKLCGLDPQKDLYLVHFRDVWLNNPGRS